ncbi:RagB/SusD family nutrient uptake outer membrane protein [Parabacteroides pacaensis]|uniref:RagB/SusD family nutrient uptake outer membrane protein n=1 Tax=Parabacteroides pacaensis TaxID=2086575 RepID=UPI000D0EE1E6|nr:RagB/SusD family nutrient uptake outer membrane protein [Parabacteroides pacaensis]
MKSVYKYILGICAVLSINACDYLDVIPDNIATLDNAFSDRYTTEQYLATCYWGMPKSAGWNENPGIFGAMEMIYNKENRTERGMKFGLGQDSPTSALINYWGSDDTYVRSLYAGIRECNTFMEGVVGVQDLNKYEKNRMIAEVKLIKAYMHFYLLSYYGPICPLRENTPVNESTQGVRVYREKVDDCFAYIIELLDEVIDSGALPSVIENRTTELGRFTKPAAYMLKAKALLYWASPLFNGNTDYNSFLDHNGEPFFNQTYDATRWTVAAEACKEAIDACNTAGIRLYQKTDYIAPKVLSDTTMLVNTLRSAVSERWNCELVWGNSSYPVNSGLQSPCFPRLEQATSSSASGKMSVPFSTVDLFYSDNGVPIEEDKEYDYAHRFDLRTGDEEHKYYIQKGEQTAAMNFDREPRFYSTLGFDRGKWYGNSYKNSPDDDSECLYPKNRFGEYSSVFQPGDYNVTGYWPKKLVCINSTFRDPNNISYEDYPFPDMRFADLLLMYAEALNESKETPDAEVYQYIDMVRERAGLKGVVESWQKYSNQPDKPHTKNGMREIIQRERKIELACEGAYYWDSHRWKTAVKEQNRPLQGWNVNAKEAVDYYTPTTIYTQTFTYKNYFAPIPEKDMTNNPQLVQNPGW